MSLVRSGVTLSLAEPLGPSTPVPPHRQGPSRFMNRDAGDYELGARSPGGFRFAEDTVQFQSHTGTHVDALAHAWSGDTLYNGYPHSSVRSTRGAQKCGADKLVPVLTRGVLVDLVASTGGPLPASTLVSSKDLEAGIREDGVHIEPGDAVLVRTGWMESRATLSNYFADEPGINEQAAVWLSEQDVALVGADNYAVEQQSATPGFPVHLQLIHKCGVPLLENLVLAELAGRLAAESRSTFLFVFAPVPLVGSTGAPVNPVVVL
ncbi:MAG TPA: cyclase family protein [Jatrophihabitans sp.]